MKATLSQANRILEPELRGLCGELSLAERVKAAEKFQRWANQLADSAQVMDPKVMPRVVLPVVPKGFMLVNLPTDERARLAELSRQIGVPLNAVMRWALTQMRTELEEQVRVAMLMGVHAGKGRRWIWGNPRN